MFSCNSDIERFYKTNHIEDIDVLPLIKPYRLWTPIPGKEVWHLEFRDSVKDKYGYISQTNVCQINVINRIIFGHCSDVSYSPNFYFIIIPDKGFEKAFDSEQEWTAYLKTKGIDDEKLYGVLEVYNDFKKDHRSLPWYDQVKNANK